MSPDQGGGRPRGAGEARRFILVARPAIASPDAERLLGSLGELHVEACDRRRLEELVGDAAVLLTHLDHRIDAALLDRAPLLEVIATPTTGLDHIDLDAAAARGIAVVSLRNDHEFLKAVTGTAELALGLMIALTRNLPAAMDHVRAGRWDRDSFVSSQLNGRTLGIVGLGRLGRQMARYGTALGMTVVAYDPQLGADDPTSVALVDDLGALAEIADVISVHASSGPASRAMIGREVLRRVRPGTLLINTARGELLDEEAVVEALADGRLGGVAVDVLADEHPQAPGMLQRNPLWQAAQRGERVLITPHIGGALRDAIAGAEHQVAQRVATLLGAAG